MDYALDAVGDGGRIRGEESCVKTPDTAGRGDRTRNQEKAGRVGQQAGFAEWLPRSLEWWRFAFALAAETKPGFLAGFADRGDRQRSRARRRDFWAAFQEIGFELS